MRKESIMLLILGIVILISFTSIILSRIGVGESPAVYSEDLVQKETQEDVKENQASSTNLTTILTTIIAIIAITMLIILTPIIIRLINRIDLI